MQDGRVLQMSISRRGNNSSNSAETAQPRNNIIAAATARAAGSQFPLRSHVVEQLRVGEPLPHGHGEVHPGEERLLGGGEVARVELGVGGAHKVDGRRRPHERVVLLINCEFVLGKLQMLYFII